MKGQVNKKDTITIEIQGPKRIRQEVVDKVFQVLMDDDLLSKITHPIAGMIVNSTLAPSDEAF